MFKSKLYASSRLSTLESEKAIEYAEFLTEFAERRMADGDEAALRWYDRNVMDMHNRNLARSEEARPFIAQLRA